MNKNKIITIVCSVLFFNAAFSSVTKGDSLQKQKQGIFTSINLRGNGVSGPMGPNFFHIIPAVELGYRFNNKFIVGSVVSLAFSGGDTTVLKKYQPYDVGVFVKYFPFKRAKSWGIMAQTGISNSTMSPLGAKLKPYGLLGIGPTLNLTKNRLGINASLMTYFGALGAPGAVTMYPPAIPFTNGNYPGFLGLSVDFRPYIGVSYLFGR